MSISERRIDRLLNPDMNEGLPAFLARHPGMESGFMIAHVAAAALLNEAKVLAHPSSIDNVPTSAGKEDHVSMGMTGALKLRTIVGLRREFTRDRIARRRRSSGVSTPAQSGRRRGASLCRRCERLRRAVDAGSFALRDIAGVAEAIRAGNLIAETKQL